MSELEGWNIARRQYQLQGYITDTDLYACGNDAVRDGWLKAYRHFHLTYTVPPLPPSEPVETPWNVETWQTKPWDNAVEKADTAVSAGDVRYMWLESGQIALKNQGFDSKVVDYVNCGSGYEAGRICYQEPHAPEKAIPGKCVIKLWVSNYGE